MAVICTIGDAVLDVVVRLDEALAPGDDVTATTRTGAGGQAANVAAWAASLGAEARCISKRGDDPAGALVAAELERRGVLLRGPVAPGRTGVVVSLVSEGAERSMASDRGVARDLRPEEVEPAFLEGVDWLHVSGYALVVEPAGRAAELAAELARAAGARVSVDLSSWTVIRDYGPARLRERLKRIGPDAVFATEAEWAALGGQSDNLSLVLKRGAAGIVVDGVAFPAHDARAVDATGAGDALAAGFLLGGPELGLAAAARCVARLGSMP
ncbi:MAG TPA: carbohydrate kinase family protein [Gaiellaceae bacterium]|nr:carbohydrate kinase family protein [Gaiellaceae bacterium]